MGLKGFTDRRAIMQRAIRCAMSAWRKWETADDSHTVKMMAIEFSVAITDVLMLAGADAERYIEQIEDNPILKDERAEWWQ